MSFLSKPKVITRISMQTRITMNFNSLADKLRAKLPSPIWNGFRKCANAALGPMNFSLETGHLRSSLKSCAVDKRGNPLPWFSYPAVHWLLAKDFSQKRVLEWGSGQSTVFWASRAKEVVAFEADPSWFENVRQRLPKNAVVHLVKEDLSDLDPTLLTTFDVIVVDGLDRFRCAEASLGHLAENGAIIVDNSEGNHGPKAGFGIIDLYAGAGLSRIDFYGYAPGVTDQRCTSVFYKDGCFLTRTAEVPKIVFTAT
jgi:hypothetical protein